MLNKHYICTGLTHVTELASKHAKARAPQTTHDSAADWQRQESGDKGNVDQWEGDLLILAIGNAQQAGESTRAVAAALFCKSGLHHAVNVVVGVTAMMKWHAATLRKLPSW